MPSSALRDDAGSALVSRYTLQDIFMQRFGRDSGHPVRDVMNRAPLSVSLGASLEAAQQVTGRLQYPITEDFALVDEEGRYRGWAPCSTC